MKKIKYSYDLNQNVILLPGRIHGPLGNRNVTFVFDPGAYRTIISTDLTDSLGYGSNKMSKKIRTGSIIGIEMGYTLIINQISILNFEFKNIEVACFDLPEQYDIDGLLGLDILEKFLVTFKHREHWIALSLLK